MSALWSILFVLIAALIQTILPTVGPFSFLSLPLVSVVVVYGVLSFKFTHALQLSLLAGLVKDSLDIGPLGGWMFAFLAVTLFFNRYREQVFAGEIAAQALFGCMGCALASLIYGTVCLMSQAPEFPLSRLVSAPIAAGLSGLILVPLCSIIIFEPLALRQRMKRRAF
jgi:rod shape-determining protein MreD